MLTLGISVQGSPKQIEELRRKVRPALRRAVERIGFGIVRQAQERVPVKTGTLRRSIRFDWAGELTAVIGPHVDYARFIEYGTHKMAARPYLTPAVEIMRRQVAGIVRNELGMAG